METTLQMETTILPGHRLEICDPVLPEGARVAVTVVVPSPPEKQAISMLDFVNSLPPGPRAFPTWEEYHKFLQEEKDSWER
jgi:hypothetical protein